MIIWGQNYSDCAYVIFFPGHKNIPKTFLNNDFHSLLSLSSSLELKNLLAVLFFLKIYFNIFYEKSNDSSILSVRLLTYLLTTDNSFLPGFHCICIMKSLPVHLHHTEIMLILITDHRQSLFHPDFQYSLIQSFLKCCISSGCRWS